MAGETTTYRVETIYDVSDKASKALSEIEKSAGRAAHASETLKSTLMGFGGAIIGGHAFHKAKEMFVDFNKEVENMKIGLSTIISANFHTSFEKAAETSGRMYDQFVKFSQTLPVTTKELFQFSIGVDQAVVANGGTIKDMINISEMGVVAAKAFGAEAGYASSELSHMLSGMVNNRMLFAKNLVGMLGMTPEEWRKLDPTKRLQLTKQVLNSDAMKGATKAFGESFSGVTSTLEDKLQILGGKVGLPLFKAITKEVSSWNDYLTKNQGSIERWAKGVGESLVSGFGVVKSAVMFMVDHSSVLIKVAEAWAMMKIGRALGGGLAGTLGGFGMGGGGGGPSAFKAVGGVGGFGAGAALGPAGAALGLGLGLGTAFNQATGFSKSLADSMAMLTGRTDATTEKYYALIENMKKFDEGLENAASRLSGVVGAGGTTAAANLAGTREWFEIQRNVIQDALREGISPTMIGRQIGTFKEAGLDSDEMNKIISGQGSAVLQKIEAHLSGIVERESSSIPLVNSLYSTGFALLSESQRATVDQKVASQRIMEAELQYYNQYGQWTVLAGKQLTAMLLGTDPDSGLKSQAKHNQTINVTINQVAAKDPDRWIADMEDYAARKVRARTTAKSALARGL